MAALPIACPLCLGVYQPQGMLEFSIEDQATKRRRTVQLCGTCAGNIADAVYNALTAAEKEASSAEPGGDRDDARGPSRPPGDLSSRSVDLQNQPDREGSGVDSGESQGATGGAGAGPADESSESPERITESTGVEKS